MSETQAIETEGSESGIIQQEGLENEVVIVSEGEGEPASEKASLPGWVHDRIRRATNRAASKAAAESSKKEQALEEEVKLLRAALSGGKDPNKAPDENDYDTTAEYLQAKEKYDNARVNQLLDQRLQAERQRAVMDSQTQAQKQKIHGHYDRAEKLGMKNYAELEDKAIEILGDEFTKAIMTQSGRSELILGSLGANTAKAREIAELAKIDPVGAYTMAIEYGAGLKVQSKTAPPPDPETQVESGGSVSSWEARIDKARQKAANTGDFGPLMELKKQARAAGVKV